MAAQVVAGLGGNHLAHHRHGRVLLAAVLLPLGRHLDFLKCRLCLAQGHIQALCLVHLYLLRSEARHGKHQRALAEADAVAALQVGLDHATLVILIVHMHHWQDVVGLLVLDNSLHILGQRRGRAQHPPYQHKGQRPGCIVHCLLLQIGCKGTNIPRDKRKKQYILN